MPTNKAKQSALLGATPQSHTHRPRWCRAEGKLQQQGKIRGPGGYVCFRSGVGWDLLVSGALTAGLPWRVTWGSQILSVLARVQLRVHVCVCVCVCFSAVGWLHPIHVYIHLLLALGLICAGL